MAKRRGRLPSPRSRSYHPSFERLEVRDLPSAGGAATASLLHAYGQVPLSFEANQGQADPQVQFLAHGAGYELALTGSDAVLTLSRVNTDAAVTSTASLRLHLVGANAVTHATGEDKLAGVSNYLIGDDPRQWHTDIPTYGQVAYRNVYPGIDLVYHGNQRQLEYDFELAPGADPAQIRLTFDGAQQGTLDSGGNLVVQTAGGQVIEHAPVLYQEGPGGRVPVAGRYELLGNQQVGFVVGAYDAGRSLVIDPTLSYSTYLGGSTDDFATGIAVDPSGNAYVTGYTDSADFPTTVGAYQRTRRGVSTAFVTKLTADGTGLVYSTYLGGSGMDQANGIAVDGSGNALVIGTTSSGDFPTTLNAFQRVLRGSKNTFVTRLNAGGTALVYSTYLGGSFVDEGNGIALDGAGNAYVTGDTSSTDFPTTAGAFQRTDRGGPNAFVAKLTADGTALAYSTFLGGTGADWGNAIAVDGAGNAFVTGQTYSSDFPTTFGSFQTLNRGGYDAFVTKFNSSGTALVYSTYLGGSQQDAGTGIAVDAAGSAYVTGATQSSDFPTMSGAFQTIKRGFQNGFVTKLNAGGSALVYSTYLGGTGYDGSAAIAVDSSGNAFVTGFTGSTDFPIAGGALQTTNRGGQNAFVAKLTPTGPGLAYSTYLGGSAWDNGFGIAVDGAGNAYVAGMTLSPNFPTTAGTYQTANKGGKDAFVAKFSFAGAATHYLLTAPTGSVAGSAFAVTVRAVDNSNFTDIRYTGTVHFTSSDGQAVLPADYAFTLADQGVHTFGGVTLATAGAQTVTATDTVNSSLIGRATVNVTPAPADHYAVLTDAANPDVAGTVFDVAVVAQDPYGNTDTNYVGTVHFGSQDPYGARLPADYSFQPSDNGSATFYGLTALFTAGSWDVTASATVSGIHGSTTVNVQAAPAVAFQVVVPPSVMSGAPFDATVLAVDPFGNIDTNYQGTIHFSTSDPDPGVSLPPDYSFQPSDAGVARFASGVTLVTPGSQALSVIDTASGISGSATVTVTSPSGAPRDRGSRGSAHTTSNEVGEPAEADPPSFLGNPFAVLAGGFDDVDRFVVVAAPPRRSRLQVI